jgi:hypothetical protein
MAKAKLLVACLLLCEHSSEMSTFPAKQITSVVPFSNIDNTLLCNLCLCKVHSSMYLVLESLSLELHPMIWDLSEQQSFAMKM